VSAKAYLGKGHPLAQVAVRLCREAGHPGRVEWLVGGVACGRCWEVAIRADERAVVQFDLPANQTPDPHYCDPIAVERASRGEQLRLTRAERAEVARRIKAGRTAWKHAHMSGTTVTRYSSGRPEVAA
jgi:hypothetical protein